MWCGAAPALLISVLNKKKLNDVGGHLMHSQSEVNPHQPLLLFLMTILLTLT